MLITRVKKKMSHQIFEHVRLETRTVKWFIKAFKLSHIKIQSLIYQSIKFQVFSKDCCSQLIFLQQEYVNSICFNLRTQASFDVSFFLSFACLSSFSTSLLIFLALARRETSKQKKLQTALISDLITNVKCRSIWIILAEIESAWSAQ